NVSGVPDVLIASFGAPYEFGTPFLRLLEAKGGTPEVNNALRKPPTGEAQIIDPSDYFEHRTGTTVTAPAAPAGSQVLGQHDGGPNDYDHLGVLNFYLMLAARVDP